MWVGDHRPGSRDGFGPAKKMDKIPDELWTLIIGGDIELYRLLVKACPQFARLTIADNSYWKAIFTKCEIDENGTERWYLANKLHKEGDLPAVIRVSGTQEWYFNGLRHRESDQPAVVFANCRLEWWFNNKCHREGAAIIHMKR